MVRAFWDVVLGFPLKFQKRLLHFSTGSDRVPVGGMADLNFKISKIDASTDWLDTADVLTVFFLIHCKHFEKY
jgi:E3 ubiquitin-protein ligase HECTD2